MKNLRVLFWLCLIAAAIFVAWKVLPAYVANFQFEESVNDAARTAAVNPQRGDEEARQAVLREAQQLNIPAQAEDIKIERVGGDVTITVDYTVHVDIPVHPFDMHFQTASKHGTFVFH